MDCNVIATDFDAMGIAQLVSLENYYIELIERAQAGLDALDAYTKAQRATALTEGLLGGIHG